MSKITAKEFIAAVLLGLTIGLIIIWTLL